MFGRRHLFAAAFASSLLAAGVALAQGQATVGLQTVTTYSTTATIAAIDTTQRTVTVTMPDGRTATHKVSDAVKVLSTTKVGDRVQVAFEERQSFVLSSPNVKTPRDRDVTAMAAANTGRGATGVVASQAVTNWWVTSVNPGANTISLVDPRGGEVRTYNVETPEARAQLPRVKPGDSLTSINTQVLVVDITPLKS
jgi:hypothetical protein